MHLTPCNRVYVPRFSLQEKQFSSSRGPERCYTNVTSKEERERKRERDRVEDGTVS